MKNDPAVLGPQGEVLRSFGEVNRRAEGWAEKFGKTGIRPRVLLALENGPDWPEILLGVWMAGGVVVPCEPSSGRGVLKEIVSLCGINITVTFNSGQIILESSESMEDLPFSQADLLKVTSGTSSGRRAVAFTAGQLLADAANLYASMGLRSDDRNLGLISFAHSYGFSNLIGMLCCFGVPVVMCYDALPRSLGGVIEAAGVTVFPGVPAMYRGLTGIGFRSTTLRLCISAGAPLAGKDATAFFEVAGLKIHSFYGASECGGICFDASEDVSVPEGFVGRPVSGVNLSKLVEGDAAPIGQEGTFPNTQGGAFACPGLRDLAPLGHKSVKYGTGRVVVSSPAVGLGYLPERPGDQLSDGKYQPPDILEECGEGFRILGRDSDFINVGGRKINPTEIEKVIRQHPGVHDVVVFGMPDPGSRGEMVAACLVGDVSEKSLRQHCGEEMPTWQIPRCWFFVAELPVSERGKISRVELRRKFGRDSGPSPSVA